MGCNCGKARAAPAPGQSVAASATPRAYEVVYPDGRREVFDTYLDAAVVHAREPGTTLAGA